MNTTATLKTPNTATHKKMILADLMAGKTVDLFYSLKNYGCSALRSRIADLRREGHAIRTEFRTVKNSVTRKPATFAVYSLEK